MTKNYDQEFGPNGVYEWPACLEIAEGLLRAAPSSASTTDCLNDYFFYMYLSYTDAPLFEEYPESEALELAESAAKSRQELFKDAKNWPLPYLVTSATYKILSAKDEGIYIIGGLGDCFFWPSLSFDEPLFDVLRSKSWGKVYGNEMRKGFRSRLRFEISSFTVTKLIWSSDKEKPCIIGDASSDAWFTCEGFASHIYTKDILRCLDLVGIDPGLAQSAVEQVFKLQSLTPLYNVLSDDPSSTLATVAKDRRRGEEGETKSPNKPVAGMHIHVLKLILGAVVVVGAVITSNRLRLSRSNWASTRPVPCFATSSMGWGCVPIPKTRKQSESSSSRSQQQPPEAITSATQESRPKRTGLFKERLSFQGTGLFKGKLSLQRNRAFIGLKPNLN